LVNGYIDLGTYWGITPYVGAGGGLNVNRISGSLNYFQTSDGTPYRGDLSPTGSYPQIWVNAAGVPISPQPNIAFAKQNWDRNIASTKYSMAWDLMAGVGIQISPSATLDIGYRYFNTGARNTILNPETGTVMKQSATSQDIRIGIRYMAD
jgi:opacity protein-like surface antigen